MLFRSELDLQSLALAAKDDWKAALALNENIDDAISIIDSIEFTTSDLSGFALANFSGNRVAVDVDAAGNGWFIDDTPETDVEFPAAPDSDVASQFDLLTVLRHEIGHRLGLGHVASVGGLMNREIAPGTRKLITTVDLEHLDHTKAHSAQLQATATDQEKLHQGLTAFASWATDFSAEMSDMLSAPFGMPFLDVGLGDLWNQTGAKITDRINQGIRDEIMTVFASGDPVSSADLIALDVISPSRTGRLGSFQVDLEVDSIPKDLQLNFDFLTDLGLDVTGLPEIEQSEPLHLEAALDVRYDFGIDAEGSFCIEDPSLVGRVTANHERPLDVSLNMGPVGVGIEQGTIPGIISTCKGQRSEERRVGKEVRSRWSPYP